RSPPSAAVHSRSGCAARHATMTEPESARMTRRSMSTARSRKWEQSRPNLSWRKVLRDRIIAARGDFYRHDHADRKYLQLVVPGLRWTTELAARSALARA